MLQPVYDACGMAGGSTLHRFNAGEYNTTIVSLSRTRLSGFLTSGCLLRVQYAKQGDLGSRVLKPRPSGTVWKRGSVARVRFQQSANHGGGYQVGACAPLL